MSRRADGLMLATAHLDLSIPESGQADILPTVLVNRTAGSMAYPALTGDDHAGIGFVARHLPSLGHSANRPCGWPARPLHRPDPAPGLRGPDGQQRLDVPPERLIEAEAFRSGAGRAACDRLRDSGVGVTAIAAAHDLSALGCFDSLAARGIRVADDESVTGCNDMTFVGRVSPPLTTVAVPYRRMAAVAARELLDLIGHDGPGPHPRRRRPAGRPRW